MESSKMDNSIICKSNKEENINNTVFKLNNFKLYKINYLVVLFISKLKYRVHKKWIDNIYNEYKKLETSNESYNTNEWLDTNPPLLFRQCANHISV